MYLLDQYGICLTDGIEVKQISYFGDFSLPFMIPTPSGIYSTPIGPTLGISGPRKDVIIREGFSHFNETLWRRYYEMTMVTQDSSDVLGIYDPVISTRIINAQFPADALHRKAPFVRVKFQTRSEPPGPTSTNPTPGSRSVVILVPALIQDGNLPAMLIDYFPYATTSQGNFPFPANGVLAYYCDITSSRAPTIIIPPMTYCTGSGWGINPYSPRTTVGIDPMQICAILADEDTSIDLFADYTGGPGLADMFNPSILRMNNIETKNTKIFNKLNK